MEHNNITKDMTINRVIKIFPKSIEAFNRFHLDSCCGGAKTLEESAKATNVDINTLLDELNKKIRNP